MEDYDVLTTLGRGSGGAVYLARNKRTSKLLALKKIQLDINRKTRTKEAVLREARILSELKHPHIVQYYDSFFDEKEEYLCIVQDYCDGGSLCDRMEAAQRSGQHFEEAQLMHWFLQVVMAIRYIHQQKILHRDIKSQNIFLTKKDVVKIGDFGIARKTEHTLDKLSTCVGTPCYLSPELCQDIPYDHKSDVWALGCLLYETAAFQPAFDANNLISLFYKIVKCQHAPLPEQYSAELLGLIDSILVKDPEERPSAGEILAMPYVQSHLNQFIAEKEGHSTNHSPEGRADSRLPASQGCGGCDQMREAECPEQFSPNHLNASTKGSHTTSATTHLAVIDGNRF